MKKKNSYKFGSSMNERGFSIAEVLVSVAITVIGMLAMSTLMVANQKETARLYEKMSLMDTSNQIRNALIAEPKCTANFSLSANFTGGLNTFDSSAIPSTGSPLGTSLMSPNGIYSGLTTTSPAVVRKNTKIAGTSATVQNISVINWMRISTDLFSADVVVDVVSDRGPIAPLKISGVAIQTDSTSPVNAKKVTRCAFGGSFIMPAAPPQLLELTVSGGARSGSKALGTWAFCASAGSKTTADDSNIKDGCLVSNVGYDWTIYLSKAGEDSLTCRAMCMNF